MMKLNLPTAAAAFAIIGAGGFFAGRVSSPGPAVTAAEPSIETRSAQALARISQEKSGTAGKNRESKPRGDTPEARKIRLAQILQAENPVKRSRALLAYLDQLGPDDYAEAVENFRSLGLADTRDPEFQLLLSSWAGVDPLKALEYVAENTQGNGAAGTILATWAATDPDAALLWAKANYEGIGANPYLAGIIRGIAETDPAKATALMATMPRSRERGDALMGMLPQVLKNGPDATRAWVASIEDENLRNGAVMASAEQMAILDPAGTVDWLLANPGDAARRRMDDVYGQWARKDSQAAISSYLSLPAGDERSRALGGIMEATATKNPTEGLALMDRYPADVNDRVVRDFVQTVFNRNPALATTQIARIGDENRRDEMYRRTLDQWFDSDPAGAAAWTQQATLPPAVREHVTNRQAGSR